MDPDLPVLIKSEEGCLRVVVDGPERLGDGTEAIDQAVAVGELGMAKHICEAHRMQPRSGAIARHFASQFEEHLRQQKIALDQFVNFRRLFRRTSRQRCRMGMRRVGLRAAGLDVGRSLPPPRDAQARIKANAVNALTMPTSTTG